MERFNKWVESGYITKNEQCSIENVEVISKDRNETAVKISEKSSRFFVRRVFSVSKLWQHSPSYEKFNEAMDKVCRNSHKNIVPVFALQTADHWCRVDTEFCETNLESYINGSGSGFGLMPWADARSQGKDTFFIVAILQQLLSGLVFIHSHDLIHGFLSPDKVVYSSKSRWWKIAEFGNPPQFNLDWLVRTGKAGYNAPERLGIGMRFKMPIFNKKSDTWSLGCILFLLLQKPNRPPFVSDDDIQSYAQHGHKSNSEFLKGLESISITVFRQWVKDMLTVNHETRPSIESFGLRFGELLKLITKPDSERQPVRRSDFLRPQFLIGTDLLPKNEHALRWEEVFPLGDMEQHTGELNRAEQVVYARERLLGEEDPNTLWSKVYHAWTCHLIGDITQSINLFKRVWAAKCKVNGPKDVGSLAAQAGLAWCMSLVQPGEAVKMFEEVQRLQKEVVRENHPEILSSRAGMGRAYLLLADHYYKKSITLKIRSQRPGQWKALKSTRKNTDQLRKENVDKGISILEDTLRRQSHKCPERGKDHPETANTRSFLAYGYHLLGRTREAAQQHRKAFATQEKSLGAYHPETLLSCAELGWRLIELGELEEASQMLEKAWEKQKVVLGVNDSETVSTIMGLQKVYTLSGEMEKLEKLKLESTRKKRKHHPD